MKKQFICALAVAVVAVMVPLSQPSIVSGVGINPDFSSLLVACTTNGFMKPCYFPDSGNTDSGTASLGECSDSITNFCFTATVNDEPAPSDFKIVASVSSYKTNTEGERDAGYEAYVNAFYLPAGNVLTGDYFGWGQRPKDQEGIGGKIDLSGVTIDDRPLNQSDTIKVVLKYSTPSLPQYSVVVSEDGMMDFSLAGQNLTLTLEGKPARIAIEEDSQHITFPDSGTIAANKCGIPSMQSIVCNVGRAESSPLAFYARSKSFINPPGSTVPAPIWVSTNATYFHFPNVEFDLTSGAYVMRVKTGAPHFLADGTTVHTGSFTAFLPNGILEQWGIDKSEAKLKAALTVTVTKGDNSAEQTPTLVINDLGVLVKFPQISYSSPVLSVLDKPSKILRKGASQPLTALIPLIGKGTATWQATGGCRISGSKLTAPKKATRCKLTVSQAKSSKILASKRTIIITVK